MSSSVQSISGSRATAVLADGQKTKSGALGNVASVAVPTILAALLFVLNNLAVLSGWLKPPVGYSAMLMVRAQDTALYLVWANGYLHQNLIPNYAAPWTTEPAFFNLFMWGLARSSQLTGWEIAGIYHVFHLIFYVIAAHALFFAVRIFTESAAQFWAVFLVTVCVVPFPSLAVLPSALLGRTGPPVGIGYFVWPSSDGFFHGISSSALVTFGTASTLLAFSLLAKYLKTEQRRYLMYAVFTAFVSALVHATEIFLIAGAGSLALLWWRGKHWRRAIPEIALFGLAGVCGLAPYVFMTIRQPWLQDLAHFSRWVLPGPPYEILLILGLPAALVVAFLVTRSQLTAPTDRLLLCWFACVLIGIYLPVMPSPQHLFDGFHYATAILLVRQASHSPLFDRIRINHSRILVAAVSLICLLSVSAYVAYYRQSFHDGRLATPERLFSTVASRDEIAAIDWMRQNAKPDQLVLAPPDHASWIATAPIHSFAGHWHWSLTFQEQSQLAKSFYNGEMNSDEAARLITDYGIRYVVVPAQGLAAGYMNGAERRADLGSLTIYEFKGNTMKPYPGRLFQKNHGIL